MLFFPSIYIFLTKPSHDLLVILFLSITSIVFQINRIRLQKNEQYLSYVRVEIVRNIFWVIATAIILFFYRHGDYIYIIYSYGVVNLMMSLPIKNSQITEKETYRESIGYLFSKRYLVLFSVISGLFPYVVFLFVENNGDDTLIASVGAAMRYQALLSMVVLSMNTVFLAKFNNNLNKKNMIDIIWKQVRNAFFISLIFIIVIYYSIPIIDSGKYPDSQIFFLLLSFSTLVSLIALPIVNSLLADNKYKEMFFSLLIGLLVGVIFYWFSAAFVGPVIIRVFIAMIIAYIVNFILNTIRYNQAKRDNENFNN